MSPHVQPHGSTRGAVRFAGVAHTRRSPSRAAVPKAGQLVCPVCRNAARLKMDGYLRQHNDLFGHPCYNKGLS